MSPTATFLLPLRTVSALRDSRDSQYMGWGVGFRSAALKRIKTLKKKPANPMSPMSPNVTNLF